MINQERLTALQNITFTVGKHKDIQDGMCVVEAASWLAEEFYSDTPACVCPVIARILVSFHDNLPDDETRTRMTRHLASKIVGTRTKRDSVLLKRMYMVHDWHIRVRTPAFLRCAGLIAEAEALDNHAPVYDDASLNDCNEITAAAWSAAESAAGSAAESAAESAAWSAAGPTAWSTAWTTAGSAAWAAALLAAGLAAESALAVTVTEVQLSFVALIERMCEVDLA